MEKIGAGDPNRPGAGGATETAGPWQVVLFPSIHHALLAEKVLKEAGVQYKFIPVPRNLSSDCGVCLRFESGLRPRVEAALRDRVEIGRIVPL